MKIICPRCLNGENPDFKLTYQEMADGRCSVCDGTGEIDICDDCTSKMKPDFCYFCKYHSTSTNQMNEQEIQLRREQTKSYFNGKREATRNWAWWKDGTQYVGCGIYTLDKALKEIEDEEHYELDCLLNSIQKTQ